MINPEALPREGEVSCRVLISQEAKEAGSDLLDIAGRGSVK